MKLCLNMIVRNEADKIERCLKSVAPFISCFAIVDTGSTDGTPDKIMQYFAREWPYIRGGIGTTAFENFEQARNAALDYARTCDLDWDYLLLVDADMELRVDCPLWAENLKGDAYDIEQRSGSISYLNRRLLSRASTARYVGVTHEYLDVAASGRVQSVFFHDHADGTNRKDKFERDVQLLEKALKTEPTNGRYWYYLGQSYRDWGKYARAADAYSRCVSFSTWDEERWSAKMNYAHCLENLGDKDGFVRELLKAYEMRPSRAEVLYDLAKFYREKGDNNTSLIFSKSGMAIPRSTDALFVNDFVYETGLKEEYSICGYYNKLEREDARKVCDKLAIQKTGYDGSRAGARHNLYWYLPSIADLAPSFTPQEIKIDLEEGWTALNPSITNYKTSLMGIVRTVNYRINEYGQYIIRGIDGTANGSNPIRTRNFLARFHPQTFVVEGVKEVAPLEPYEPKFPLVVGFEDMRLFPYAGELWTSSCVRDMNEEGYCEQVLARIDGHKLVDVKRMLREPRLYEKNWMPLPTIHGLRFVYRLGEVIDTNGKTVRKHDDVPFAVDRISGGSQLLYFYDGYIAIVHEAHSLPQEPHKRYYTHRFVYFSPDFNVRNISQAFYLHGKQIEFAAGIANAGNKIAISYGIKDSAAWIGTIDKEDVARLVNA